MGIVISRKCGEAVVMDGPAVVRVVGQDGRRILLRVEVKGATGVVREEVVAKWGQAGKPDVQAKRS